jgi:hypothetical protein
VVSLPSFGAMTYRTPKTPKQCPRHAFRLKPTENPVAQQLLTAARAADTLRKIFLRTLL